MSYRSFDIIIFGASSEVGRCIAKFIYRHRTFEKWAIMGRSHAKLSSLSAELREMGLGFPTPDILLADAQDFRSLRDIFIETRILMNCVAPYRILGKDIIEACIMARCDYLDLCSEPLFIDSSYLDFHVEAINKSVCILHGCGMESSIFCAAFTFFQQNFQPHQCNSLESFLTIHSENKCGASIAAEIDENELQSFVHNRAERQQLAETRSNIDSKFKTPIIQHPGRRLDKRKGYFFERKIGKFAVASFGPDTAVILHSIRSLAIFNAASGAGESMMWPQYFSYLTVDDYYSASSAAFSRSLRNALAAFPLGRAVLLAFPGAFSTPEKGVDKIDQICDASAVTQPMPAHDTGNGSGSIEKCEATPLHNNEHLLLDTTEYPSFELVFIGKGYCFRSADRMHGEEIVQSKLEVRQGVEDVEQEENVSMLSKSTITDEQISEALFNMNAVENASADFAGDLNETINVVDDEVGGTSFGLASCGLQWGKESTGHGYTDDLSDRVPVELKVRMRGPTGLSTIEVSALCAIASAAFLRDKRRAELQSAQEGEGRAPVTATTSSRGAGASSSGAYGSATPVAAAASVPSASKTAGRGGVYTPLSASFTDGASLLNCMREFARIDFRVISDVTRIGVGLSHGIPDKAAAAGYSGGSEARPSPEPTVRSFATTGSVSTPVAEAAASFVFPQDEIVPPATAAICGSGKNELKFFDSQEESKVSFIG